MHESLWQFLFANNLDLSPSISLQFTLLQPKIEKNHLKSIFLGVKVTDVDICKKLVVSACYDKQHCRAYLQHARQANKGQITTF